MRRYDIPGQAALEIEHLLLDVNGTLSDRGALLDACREPLRRLRQGLELHLLSADTYGTLDATAAELEIAARRVTDGEEKLRVVRELGARGCAAIGNGRNDAAMLGAAAVGIAVVGPEGASGAALRTADVVCASTVVALELLLDADALAATLRP